MKVKQKLNTKEVVKRWNDLKPTWTKILPTGKVFHNSARWKWMSVNNSFTLHLHLPWLGVRLIWKSRFPPSAIMSLTSRAEEETPNLRDQRTIFVGNLPIEIASKRVSQYHFPLFFTQTLYKLAFVETTTTAYSNFCAHCKNWISTVPFHTIPNTYVQTTDFWRWRRQYH